MRYDDKIITQIQRTAMCCLQSRWKHFISTEVVMVIILFASAVASLRKRQTRTFANAIELSGCTLYCHRAFHSMRWLLGTRQGGGRIGINTNTHHRDDEQQLHRFHYRYGGDDDADNGLPR